MRKKRAREREGKYMLHVSVLLSFCAWRKGGDDMRARKGRVVGENG